MTARSLGGCAGFSITRTRRSPSNCATPNSRASGTRLRKMQASSSEAANACTYGTMPWVRKLSPRNVTNGALAHRLARERGSPGRCRRARACVDVADPCAKRLTVACGRAHLVARLRRDDDRDVAHRRFDEVLDAVEEDRLVGDGDELLRAGVGERPQPAPFAAADHQTLQLALHRADCTPCPEAGPPPESLARSARQEADDHGRQGQDRDRDGIGRRGRAGRGPRPRAARRKRRDQLLAVGGRRPRGGRVGRGRRRARAAGAGRRLAR